MNSKDQVQRFIFEDYDVRGQLVGLEESYRSAIENHSYPESIKKLVGDCLSTAALLGTSLKVEGTVSIQAQGKGDLSLIMAECHHGHEVRAVARWQGECSQGNFRELLGTGELFITIDPDEGQGYQGIVPLEGNSLAECIEMYFEKSEQLKTRIWLNTKPGEFASGLFIQALPSKSHGTDLSEEDQANFARICLLSETLTPHESIQDDNETILHRLYHEDTIRVFPAQYLSYKCGCDRDRTIKALVALGHEETRRMFAEQPELLVKCEFCNTRYQFIFDDLAPYFTGTVNPAGTTNPTTH